MTPHGTSEQVIHQQAADALALLSLMRQTDVRTFVDGAPSTDAALLLEAAGFIDLQTTSDGGVKLYVARLIQEQ